MWIEHGFSSPLDTTISLFSYHLPDSLPCMHGPGKPWGLLYSCHTGHRQPSGVAAPTWWVLMEWSSATVQSTSGSGDPEPLQVMTAFSPSRTVRFTWLTLISGRSRGAKKTAQVWGRIFYSQPQEVCGLRCHRAAFQISLQHPEMSSMRQQNGLALLRKGPRKGGVLETGENLDTGDIVAEQTLSSASNSKAAVQFWPLFLSHNPHTHLSTPTEAAHEGSHLG